MRWKLVLIASFLATLVGAGGALGLVLGLMGSTIRLAVPADRYSLLALLVPVAAIGFASLFVYRHTARRRKMQAFLTALLSTLLTLTVLIAASVLSASSPAREMPPQPPRNTA